MRDTDLFGMALGIEPPWVVTKSEFDAAAKRLDIHLDFARGSRFACPECGAAGCPAYDSEEKTWRHLNFFQHEAYPGLRRGRLCMRGCRGSPARGAGSSRYRFAGRGRTAVLRCCSRRWSWPWCKQCRWPLSRG